MRPRCAARPRGFTLVEMTVAALLMTLVGAILGAAWTAFGRPAISAVARSRMALEANLAAEAIARDVGQLARPESLGNDSRPSNAAPDGSTLSLTIDDGTGSMRTVTYSLGTGDPGTLVRTDGAETRVIARLVSDFQAQATTMSVGPDGEAVSGVRIDLTLTHRVHDRDPDGTRRNDHTRRYTLFLPDAP